MTCPAQTSSRRITILLVDDDPDCRTLIREIIASTPARADVREAPDGRTALDYLRGRGEFQDAARPDLIYLDVEMPGLSGQQVLEAIRADAALEAVRVVMLTGVDDEQSRRRALQAGADAYVVKPVDPARLVHVVRRSVKYWAEPRRAPARHAAHAPAPTGTQPNE